MNFNDTFDEIEPRKYQINLAEIATKQNTIIYLPTGTGKTLIAVLIIKQLSAPLQRPLSQGGKISILIVNTHALVNQQTQYFLRFAPFDVIGYGGKKNITSKTLSYWKHEFDRYQMYIMTPKVLVNLLEANFLSLSNVNVLIFDECHHAVNNHPMKKIMANFHKLADPPRIVGLTATLINRNCSPTKIAQEIANLERALYSKVTSMELSNIAKFSTNPNEILKTYEKNTNDIQNYALSQLQDITYTLQAFQQDEDAVKKINEMLNIIQDTIQQIQMLGIYGGNLVFTIRLEQLKVFLKNTDSMVQTCFVKAVITKFQTLKAFFKYHIKRYCGSKLVCDFSSKKVNALIDILEEHEQTLNKELCGIIFVKRRFTARILYEILLVLSETDSNFQYLRPKYVLGNNTNSNNNSVLEFHSSTTYKQILQQFVSNEINLLVSSNVLEEGVDIPICSLVINFDKPLNYCSYIQAKGRAKHRDAMYYIMVSTDKYLKFKNVHEEYKQIEETLYQHLNGNKNEEILQNKQHFEDTEDTPQNSISNKNFNIDFESATHVLENYCMSLPRHAYTCNEMQWHFEKSEGNVNSYKAVLFLPILDSEIEEIQGPFMETKRLAKSATALRALEFLYRNGKLDGNLLAKDNSSQILIENDMFGLDEFHKATEMKNDNTKYRKIYQKNIPAVCKRQIKANKNVYLHIINLKPYFSSENDEMYQCYTSQHCYGVLTCQPLPQLCEFSVYTPTGTILVDFCVNYGVVALNETEICNIKRFHYFIFKNILDLVKPFLVFNNDEDAEILMVVPVCKISNRHKIDFRIIDLIREIGKFDLSNGADKYQKPEDYLGKIVTSLQETKTKVYLITKIVIKSEEMESDSDDNVEQSDTLPKLPKKQLLGKNLCSRLNYLKPYNKNNHSRMEEFEELLDPENCTVQKFPADLWLQAKLLSNILYRVKSLLNAEELRKQIALETNLGIINLKHGQVWKPLTVNATFTSNCKDHLTSRNSSDEELGAVPSLAMNVSLGTLNQKFYKQLPAFAQLKPNNFENYLNVTYHGGNYQNNLISTAMGNDTKKGIHIEELINNHLRQQNNENNIGPHMADVFKALTTAKCGDIVNLERLETLGDSFLKLSVSLFITLRYPNYNEGEASILKGRIISNQNLFSVGLSKNLDKYINSSALPSLTWNPPCFCVPQKYRDSTSYFTLNTSFLNLQFSEDEQLSGKLSKNVHHQTVNYGSVKLEGNRYLTNLVHNSLDVQVLSNKCVADSVEALLGVYFEFCGFIGGLKLLKWLNVIPLAEEIENLLSEPLPKPQLVQCTTRDIDFHIPAWRNIEAKLGYHFNNRAYLLQALTHSSYTVNRLTHCYQKLEFLGDAILDFLITCHIYKNCDNLNPGQLTDLRSALVNNITFASFAVRCEVHKFILFCNQNLVQYIEKFVQFQESKNFVIDDDVLIWIEENELYIAEQIEVPKILGDVFEALAAAVFLDSGMDFQMVWNVFYKIMSKEIELFCNKIPKNAIRLIHEAVEVQAKYHEPVIIDNGLRTMIGLDFMVNGIKKTVYGFGKNKIFAKKAAAKIALRVLNKNSKHRL